MRDGYLLKKNVLSMDVYITDDGYLMYRADFVPYVLWLICEYKATSQYWESVLTTEFWGDQLLDPQILNEIINE